MTRVATEPSARTNAGSVAIEAGGFPELSGVYFERIRLPDDVDVIHGWVNRQEARYWGLVGKSYSEVLAAYTEITRRADVYLGYVSGYGAEQRVPGCLVEVYDPATDEIGRHYDVRRGDRGMHVLVAPAQTPIHGFSRRVFEAVLAFLFSDSDVTRVVVEPDIRNAKIHALNRYAGFRYERPVFLEAKVAHLAFLTRKRWLARRGCVAEPLPESAVATAAEQWLSANRWLSAKAIGEFCHERLLFPELVERGASGEADVYEVGDPSVARRYRFKARRFRLDHWHVEPESLRVNDNGEVGNIDVVQFIIDVRDQLNVGPNVLSVYLEEVLNTLVGRVYRLNHQTLSAADLVHAEFQEVEGAMLEGHPCFVANSGRVGFDVQDQAQFTPEAGAPMRLLWLAIRKAQVTVATTTGLSFEQLVREELSEDLYREFEGVLRARGLEPSEYVWMPVHPWQWENRLAMSFGGEVARDAIVVLGTSSDQYQAQQSVRTVFNLTHPEKHYVKMALSVLNMGFMRGLSADYLEGTPAINDWVESTLGGDTELAARGFRLLKEIAGVGYRHPEFNRVDRASPYRKMCAALWRESPIPKLAPGQRVMTLAALLHRDARGQALLPQLILASGLTPKQWLSRLLDAYLVPVVHCFFAYELAFMPHGENIILTLEQHAPVGVFLKDIAEEVALFSETKPLPAEVERIRVSVPRRQRALSIQTDVVDCYLRHLAPLFCELPTTTEHDFWETVRDCLRAYQERHPEFRSQFAEADLFGKTFLRSCLNRLQLRNNRQMVDLASPAAALQFAGTLDNPVCLEP